MIGIIGAGNMGQAIASRLTGKVILSDVDPAKLLKFRKNRRILVSRDNIGLVKSSHIIILAVKPQHIAEVLKEIRVFVGKKLIISIAAGVETNFIEKILGRVRVIRVMPNMPSLVGKGISAITAGNYAGKKDLVRARKIFLNLGEVCEVKERFMDAITAVSGSGPAYYFLFTALLEKAACECGLKKDLARKLAKATFIGTSACSGATDISMQDFIKRVASKGGTTEAALKVFKKRNLERIVKEAVRAAVERSCYLRKC